MGEQYDRYASITAAGVAGTLDMSTLRCRFDIKAHPTSSPSQAIIKITNQLPATGQQFASPTSEWKTITIEAGYQSGHGIIFTGNIIQGIYGRESPTDTLTTIVAADGDHGHNYAKVNTTLPPGSTPQQHLQIAMQSMNPFGITLGYIGVDLSTPTYPRAFTLYGMARDVLTNIAKSKNAMFYYDSQKVTMLPIGGSVPGGVIILNSNTGLIGMPTMTTQGLYVRCLINPAIKRGSQIYIDQKDVQGALQKVEITGTIIPGVIPSIAADGLYTALKIDYMGDTRGDPWYMDLLCLAVNASPGHSTLATEYAPPLGGESG